MNKMGIRLFIFALSVALLTGMAARSYAQTPDTRTPSADPGRVDQQIHTPESIMGTVPQIEVRDMPVKGAPEGSDKIRLTLREVVLEGVTVYEPGELAAVYADKIGQTITLTDVYAIAADLTRKYRNDGYILTQVVVPPQTIEGGIVRLQVVEGYVDGIQINSTSDAGTIALINKYVAPVRTSGQALNVKALERALLLINDLPGVTARSILTPSATRTGAADMIVVIEDKAYDALVGADNFGTVYLGPVQFTAAGSLNSALNLGERISGQFVIAPSSENVELYYGSLNYEQPLFGKGSILEFFASQSYTEPGDNLEPFEVKGDSLLLGSRLRHPFIRSRGTNLTGRLTFDYRNVNSQSNIDITREDRIRALRVGSRFEHLDTFLGAGYNVVDLEVSHGLEILGANGNDDVGTSRVAAKPDFYKIEGEIQRLQKITSSINLLAAVSGQWASNALYSSEEFGVGGLNYGRGFDPSEVVGEDGVAGKVELQWNKPIDFGVVENYQLYGFYDAGTVWNRDPLSLDQKTDTLHSSGFGLRANLTQNTNAGALMAFPLHRDVQTKGDRDPRFFVNLSHKF